MSSYSEEEIMKICKTYFSLKKFFSDSEFIDEKYVDLCLSIDEKFNKKYREYVGIEKDSPLPENEEEKVDVYSKILAFWNIQSNEILFGNKTNREEYIIVCRWIQETLYNIDTDNNTMKRIIDQSNELVKIYQKN